MAGSGDDDSRSRRPSRREQTSPGVGELSDAGPHERVTLDFSGPPLALPGEGGEGDLTLETGGLEAGGRGGGGTALDLDLGELEAEGEGAGAPDQDAWTRDRVGRGSRVHPSVRSQRSTAPRPGDPRALPEEERPDALGLVERSRPSQPNVDLAVEMADRYALGDFTGALRAAELLLGRDPEHGEALRYAQSSRDRLVQLYTSRLGSMDRVPRVAVPDSEVRWLGLDHKAGFLLSRVDGEQTLEEIIDVSGMPRLEALKTLAELLEAGAITFEERSGG